MTTKLVLIDRDGVINEEVQDGYVEAPEELLIYPRALQAFALFKKHGFTCVVITNQSVVARGRITKDELDAIHNHLRETVAANNGHITDIHVCMDHPDSPTNRRKPAPGMLLEAIAAYGSDAASTPMIGDSIVDMQAAASAGCKRYLVMTGKGPITQGRLTQNLYPVTLCEDILDAATLIVSAKT